MWTVNFIFCYFFCWLQQFLEFDTWKENKRAEKRGKRSKKSFSEGAHIRGRKGKRGKLKEERKFYFDHKFSHSCYFIVARTTMNFVAVLSLKLCTIAENSQNELCCLSPSVWDAMLMMIKEKQTFIVLVRRVLCYNALGVRMKSSRKGHYRMWQKFLYYIVRKSVQLNGKWMFDTELICKSFTLGHIESERNQMDFKLLL